LKIPLQKKVEKFIGNHEITLYNSGFIIRHLGLILSTNILRSQRFLEKYRKFQTYGFCKKGRKNYLADVLAWLIRSLKMFFKTVFYGQKIIEDQENGSKFELSTWYGK
jgi:hypothetical protein